jgi:proteasome alpha subunit
VGQYDEYERLRILGIRQADLKGYTYSREDVSARSLASLYSQVLGQIFTESMKPFEVEILIAGVGETADGCELYHVTFDGFMTDEHRFAALGGQADALKTFLGEQYTDVPALDAAIRMGVDALRSVGETSVAAEQAEAAVLDRSLTRRKFRRLDESEIASALA